MSMVLNSLSVVGQNGTPSGVTIATIDQNGLVMGAGYPVKQGSSVLHDKVDVPFMALTATTAISQFIWLVREGVWVVSGMSLYFQTGSTSGTLTVTRDTSTDAPGAGTAQLTGTVSLAAAAQQTIVNGTVIATPNEFSPGHRVGLLIAGTVTNLVALIGSVTMQRIR